MSSTDVAKFFLEDVWSEEDMVLVQKLSEELLDSYVDILSTHYDLSKRDIFHFCRDMTYHAISVFIDASYRLKNIFYLQQPNQFNQKKSSADFDSFFDSRTVDLALESSIVLRGKLSNLIAACLGYPYPFADITSEPQPIILEETGIRVSSKQKKWLLNNYLWRVPQKLGNLSKGFFNRHVRMKKGKCFRMGYVSLDREHFFQIPGIKFTPLDIDLKDFLGETTIENRKTVYEELVDIFVERSSLLEGWQKVIGVRPCIDFFKVLFGFIVLFSKPLLCDSKKLKKAIGFCYEQIQTKNIQALLSTGFWGSLPKAIIAVAGRKLNLPIIQYQSSGYYALHDRGQGFEGKELQGIDYLLTWGSYQEKNNNFHLPKFIQTPSFNLYSLNQRGKTRHSKRRRFFKILYTTPGLSPIFRMENRFGCHPDLLLGHRSLMQTIFSNLDNSKELKNFHLLVKIKGWNYELYKGYEYMLFAQIKLNKIKVEYITQGTSDRYFDYVNMHFIGSAVSTSIMEGFAYNIPTVIFWNKKMYKVKSSQRQLFERMVGVGLIATTAQQAVKSIKRIYHEPEWWYSDQPQELKDEYLNRFGYFSNDWRKKISQSLNVAVKNFKEKKLKISNAREQKLNEARI